MNKARRKSLKAVIEKIEQLTSVIEEAKEDLQAIIDEEQEAFDAMPEGIQGSDRGQQMEEYINSMEEVMAILEDLDTEDMCQTLGEIAEG